MRLNRTRDLRSAAELLCERLGVTIEEIRAYQVDGEKPNKKETKDIKSVKELQKECDEKGISYDKRTGVKKLQTLIDNHKEITDIEMEVRVVTEEDLVSNPKLVEEGIQVGDETELPKSKE